MAETTKNEDEVGALWIKTSARGEFMTGTVNGQAVVVFRNDRKAEGSKAAGLANPQGEAEIGRAVLMGCDMSALKFPKGQLQVETKREKRLTDAQLEDAARAAVRRRDGRRCTVPGCREAGAHLHHIVYRSRSKKLRWATSNLCFLCVAHHALEHAGRIHISGNADEHLTITGDKKDLSFKL